MFHKEPLTYEDPVYFIKASNIPLKNHDPNLYLDTEMSDGRRR